jgi:hypothetical protein
LAELPVPRWEGFWQEMESWKQNGNPVSQALCKERRAKGKLGTLPSDPEYLVIK